VKVNLQGPKTWVEIMPIMAPPKAGVAKGGPVPNPWARKPPPAPKVEPRDDHTAQPSTKATATKDPEPPKHLPDASAPVVPDRTEVVDASAPVVPLPPDAAVVASNDPPAATTSASAAPTSTAPEGDPNGVENGLRKGALDRYRAQLAAWFLSRFVIKGMIPFDKLKTLRSIATVQVNDRRMTGFNVGSASGDPVFDGQVRAALQGASGQLLPKPPDNYPEALSQSVTVSFQCTVQAACE